MLALRLLALFAVLKAIENVGSKKTPKIELPEWWRNLTENHDTTQRMTKLQEASKLVDENLEMAKSKQGLLLEKFVSTEEAVCALACGARPDCHFIKIKILFLSLKSIKYECQLYSEYGNVIVEPEFTDSLCNGLVNSVEKMKSWLGQGRNLMRTDEFFV